MLVLKKSVSDQIFKIVLRSPLYVENTNIYIKIDDYYGNNLVDETISLASDSWTTSVISGKGSTQPKIIDVEDATDATPGKFFISNGAMWEKINIVNVDTVAKKLYIDAALKSQYPVGATITPAYVNYTIPDAVVAEEIQIIINFGYFGVTGQYVGQNEEGRVSNNPVLNPVTEEDILKIWPQLTSIQSAQTANNENEDRLETVWANVCARLASSGLKPEQFKAVSGLKQIIILEFGYLLGLSGIDPTGSTSPVEFREMIRKDLRAKWEDLWTSQAYVERGNDSTQATSDKLTGRKLRW
jgi:hypothetical protein